MTNISENRLRALYTPIAETQRADRQGCPSPDDLQSLVHREGDEEARLALLDHVMACRDCRSEFNLLRAVEKGGRQLTEETSPARASESTKKAFGRSRWTWMASAIAAVAVLAVGFQAYRGPEAVDTDRVRGTDDPVTLIAPVADAVVDARVPIQFVWHSVPRSMNYQLEVLDSAGQIVYTTTTNDTTAVFLDAQSKVDPAMPYRWWVKASMPSGETQRSTMQPVRFSIQ